jgi:hypothetical protein
MIKFLKKICSWEWIQYHFSSMVEIVFYTFPFRKNSPGSLIINPVGLIAFISIFICLDIYYEALFHLYYNRSAIGVFDFLLAFAFTLFITFVFKKFCTFIKYDGFQLTLLDYDFYDKKETFFLSSQFQGLYLLTDDMRGTKNYKVCFAMKNGTNILLCASTKKDKAEKELEKYKEIFSLKEISSEGKSNPVNNFFTGVTSSTDSTF